jgi:LysM repeat protein
MFSKRTMRWTLVVGLLVAILAAPKPALAWSGCGPSYVVQWGDTLGSVADKCGVSLDGLRQANPNVGDWLYAGQTVSIPDGYPGGGYQDGGYQGGGYQGGYQGGGNCYDFQGGSNCSGYQDGGNCYGYPGGSNCYGFQAGSNCSTCGNCQTYGGSGNCYGGCYSNQYVAASGQTYVVQRGDTMRLIADRLGIPVCDLIRVNPQISNPSLIYAGQVLCLPGYSAQAGYFKDGQNSAYQPWGAKYGHFEHKYSANLYTVQAGEKLKDIAKKFDTTQEDLLDLNPSLKGKAGNIYKGMVLVLW